MAGLGKKKSKAGKPKGETGPAITDPRFANIQTDPRYRLPSKRQTHVKLDKRFAHVLDDKDFSSNAPVDRYGRKLRKDDTKEKLKEFYQVDEDEDEDEDEDSADDDEEVQKELKRVNAASYDPARDGGFESSSSEESSSEDEEEAEEDVIEFPDQQRADVPLGEVTNRIAVVNLDWENIRAEDLMAVFSSFLPSGGRVLNATVYPSEFGKERMEREEVEGPPKEIFASGKKKNTSDDSEEEQLDSDEEEEEIKKSMLKADDGEEFNSTQLRRYQLDRLRYYYAIIKFSSKDVAKHVYDLVDGAEYLSSANFFDLRFVPEDTDFSDDKPRDECSRIPDGYKPTEFVTDALQHSKVKLTWDADDKTRKEAQARAFRGSRQDIDENDLKAYLGSDSSENEDSDDEDGGVEVVDNTAGEATTTKLSKKEAERQRMRALLGLSAEPTRTKAERPVGEMEVTFTSGLAGGHGKDTIFENEPEIEESTIDKYVRKERERKKRRKEKLKAKSSAGDSAAADSEDNEAGPVEVPQQVEEEMGFNDPFFDDPDGKATAGSRRKEERRKKREERAAEEAASAAQRAELELLMVDDKKVNIKHFDMNEIEKAEKQARKKGKGKKGKKVEPAQADDFEVNVSDPRFARLYDTHDFAIDPTNPRFKSTSGMKALLDEGRKRRRAGDDAEPEAPAESRDGKKKQKKSSKESSSEELKRLVAKVKRSH
ncbi:Pre-rRNA processing protein Esf1, putative [Penicillium digitatum]|uniref:Pre-rRNA processing protein Esf1, putative n=3 Tax=Penicillium digitatum TaxID=36651 RepID=K9F820_PEND2|nr:Pre-rRNA processing protein Esf1, putative [Penicillium digitatum Pd1]EKV04575.1 Pre-rRNA processing protein Esf1, putative [Penicillium digitatum Pd1]EKV05540.1 Pre-rRNA processing protein Esf1, putative [Penicillium digitatum PHI26]QQK45586.1 Pre-rRNA processing protein Esf1, putative [Penicillium digitatum]